MQPIITSLLSFGMSGRVFHAPFIHLHPGFQLKSVWERTKNESQQFYPSVQVLRSMDEILEDPEVELVVVNTPTGTHFDYTRRVLEAGKSAIVEKAFTTTLAEAEELRELANRKGLFVSVFQNRRWDSDFRTVKKVLADGCLGEIMEAEFHYDRYNDQLSPKAHKETPAPGAGIVYDLSPHLIDQALSVFGMPESVFADLRITRPGSRVDDYFEILLYYPVLRVRLKSGYQVPEPIPSYVIHGRQGSFLKSRADIQESMLLQHIPPSAPDWGMEPASEMGLLCTLQGGKLVRENIHSLPGNYYLYYDGIYKAMREGAELPVTATDGVNTMRIIEAVFTSHATGKRIDLPHA